MSLALFGACLAALSQLAVVYPHKAPGDSFSPRTWEKKGAWWMLLASLSLQLFLIGVAPHSDSGVVGWIASLSLSGIVVVFLRGSKPHWMSSVGALSLLVSIGGALWR